MWQFTVLLRSLIVFEALRNSSRTLEVVRSRLKLLKGSRGCSQLLEDVKMFGAGIICPKLIEIVKLFGLVRNHLKILVSF